MLWLDWRGISVNYWHQTIVGRERILFSTTWAEGMDSLLQKCPADVVDKAPQAARSWLVRIWVKRHVRNHNADVFDCRNIRRTRVYLTDHVVLFLSFILLDVENVAFLFIKNSKLFIVVCATYFLQSNQVQICLLLRL